MSIESGIADLHLHTVASDGTDTVDQRVEQANERDLDAIAITDHDRIPDELSAPLTNRQSIEVVTGAEIRADIEGTKVEILGYFVDPSSNTLSDVLEQARAYRRERNRRLISELNAVTPLELDYHELSESVRGGLGRPHLAGVLVEEGLVEDVGAAFEQYLAEDGSCFVPMERIDYPEVLAAIHEAGGVTSLAHPGRIRTDDVDSILETLARTGLDAIETKYPYRDGVSFGVDAARTAVERLDLLATGGSDCHGTQSEKFRIGSVRTGIQDYTSLLAHARADLNSSIIDF
jgi:predicted metal-dependent phosphoesterase TrpH